VELYIVAMLEVVISIAVIRNSFNI